MFSEIDIEHLPIEILGLNSRVEGGEVIVVKRGATPVVELRSMASNQSGSRPFGLCRGEFEVPDDFDAPLPVEHLRDFDN